MTCDLVTELTITGWSELRQAFICTYKPYPDTRTKPVETNEQKDFPSETV